MLLTNVYVTGNIYEESHYRIDPYEKISPFPSFQKRGMIPSFAKGSLEGFLLHVVMIVKLVISNGFFRLHGKLGEVIECPKTV